MVNNNDIFQVIIANKFRENVKTMPIQGLKEITNLMVGQEAAKMVFEAKIFKQETKAIQREGAIRSKDDMSAFTMMLAAPIAILDKFEVPDVFRRDVSTQSHSRVERYRNLLSNSAIQKNGSFIVEHQVTESSPKEIGLECVHVARLFDDQGK